MVKVKPALFEVLHELQAEAVLMRLHKLALKQNS